MLESFSALMFPKDTRDFCQNVDSSLVALASVLWACISYHLPWEVSAAGHGAHIDEAALAVMRCVSLFPIEEP